MLRLLGSLTLSAAALALPACSTNPATGRSQLILTNSEEVSAMGEAAKPELIKEYGGEVESRPLRQYVSEVGRRLARHVEPEYGDIKWEFITLESEIINAFALPGGKVFISRGLLEKLNNEAALAAVLGHEIGHVTARHVDERISQATLLSGLGQVAGAAAGGGESAAAQIVPLIVGMGGQGYLLKFGRDQERESDMQGMKYMVRAGYDPAGAADVMQVLIDASEGGRGWEILATHPNPESRLADVREMLRTEYAYTQNNPEFRKFEARFSREAAPHLR